MLHLLDNRKFLVFVFLAGLAVLLVSNHLALWDQDEAAYAGFALQMQQSGDWLVPEFTWSEVHRKTPLHFWLIALSFELFGTTEFALRLPGVLAAWGSCLLMFYMGGRVFGRNRGRGAAVVMLTSLLLPGVAKMAVTDATLLFFETLAVLSLFGVLKRQQQWYWLSLWLGVAGGLLTKGPPVWILIFGILLVLFIFQRQRSRILLLGLWSLTASLPLLIWGWATWRSDGGAFVQWLIDWYILKRVGGSVFGQTGPPGYFLIIFILAFLPWLTFLPRALVHLFRGFGRSYSRSPFQVYLVAWMAAGWWLYELLPSKLPAYALGAYPGVALLIADQALRFQVLGLRTSLLFKLGWWFYLLLGTGVAVMAVWSGIENLDSLLGWAGACAAGLVLGLSTWIAAQALHQENMVRGLRWSVGGVLVFMLLAWGLVLPAIEEQRGVTKRVAQAALSRAEPGQEIGLWVHYPQPSLAFYLQRAEVPYRVAGEEKFRTALAETPGPEIWVISGRYIQQLREEGVELEAFYMQRLSGWITDKGEEVDYWVLELP